PGLGQRSRSRTEGNERTEGQRAPNVPRSVLHRRGWLRKDNEQATSETSDQGHRGDRQGMTGAAIRSSDVLRLPRPLAVAANPSSRRIPATSPQWPWPRYRSVGEIASTIRFDTIRRGCVPSLVCWFFDHRKPQQLCHLPQDGLGMLLSLPVEAGENGFGDGFPLRGRGRPLTRAPLPLLHQHPYDRLSLPPALRA